MKILEVTDDRYCLFLISEDLKKIDVSNEKDLELLLTKALLKLKNIYNLKLFGLYSVEMHISNKDGAFIYIEKTDTFIQYKDIDLKIKIFKNSKFYFKVSDFEIIKDMNNIYFYNEYYYIETNEIKNLLNYIEMGEIVHSDNINISEAIKIK